ncbi:DinB family protein [Nocardiopsis aegyptia]|uniref:Putative damage-inducible protein DinB n=1 Tax=Nocardiopsis aegyptia TaxID=220378 RepID=A0A7Z0EQF7_9ACTN|nr:DinB family protein [Nocardiopsis aegyptia]NYJ35518.1 putative damage-inducible protein DinB [Nocardiopsis aegyptia]
MTTRTENTRTADTEREALLRVLEEQRGNLRYAVRGLTDEQARRRTTVSALCLGGVVKHVARGEKHWVRFILEGDPGTDYESPETYAVHEDSFRLLEGETLQGVLEEYERVAASTERIVRDLPDLEVTQKLPTAPWFPEETSWTAREVLLHIIAENAQHNGHADIIREELDGQKTMG